MKRRIFVFLILLSCLIYIGAGAEEAVSGDDQNQDDLIVTYEDDIPENDDAAGQELRENTLGGGFRSDSGDIYVVNVSLREDGKYTLYGMFGDKEINETGEWSVADDSLILVSDLQPGIEQVIRFNNGFGTINIDGVKIHLNLSEDAKGFFEDVGLGVPAGMPGERVTPSPTPTPPPTPVPPPTPTPTPSPTPKPAYEDIEGWPDLVSAAIKSTSATSHLINKNNPYEYAPEKMTDGIESTCWQFSDKELKTTYAEFEFEQPADIDILWIKNGFWTITKGYDQYTRNCRPKQIVLQFRYEGSSEFTDDVKINIKDDKKRKDWQRLNFKARKQVAAVRLLVKSIYRGTKFKHDVCISEIMFVHDKGK